MLVLSRKSQEQIVVQGPEKECLLKITVLEIQGGRVRLGFQAGSDILVHRWELWERIRAHGQVPRQRQSFGPAPYAPDGS